MANLLAVLGVMAAMVPLKDPTTPINGVVSSSASPQVAASSLPKLQSVILGSGPAVAVLGGKDYRHGETVSGWRIAAIQQDRVVLEKGGERTTLTLFAKRIVR